MARGAPPHGTYTTILGEFAIHGSASSLLTEDRHVGTRKDAFYMKLLVTITSLAVAALPILGCAVTPDESADDDVDSAASISDGLSAECRDEFDVLRRNTAKYHDVRKAVADGYIESGPCTVSPPFVPPSQAGAMGYHYVNFSLLGKPVDKNRPSILLYEPTANGGRRLVAVEYFNAVICNGAPWMGTGVPNDPTNPPPMASGQCAPTPNNPPQVFGSSFEGPMPGHIEGMPWHFDKHVWLYKKNPHGIFTEWNPRVTCTP